MKLSLAKENTTLTQSAVQPHHYTATHKDRVYTVKRSLSPHTIRFGKNAEDDRGFLCGMNEFVLTSYPKRYKALSNIYRYISKRTPPEYLVFIVMTLNFPIFILGGILHIHAGEPVAQISLYTFVSILVLALVLLTISFVAESKRKSQEQKTKFVLPLAVGKTPLTKKAQREFSYDHMESKVFSSVGLYNDDFQYYDIESLLSVQNAYEHLNEIYTAQYRNTHMPLPLKKHEGTVSNSTKQTVPDEQLRGAEYVYELEVRQANEKYMFSMKEASLDRV